VEILALFLNLIQSYPVSDIVEGVEFVVKFELAYGQPGTNLRTYVVSSGAYDDTLLDGLSTRLQPAIKSTCTGMDLWLGSERIPVTFLYFPGQSRCRQPAVSGRGVEALEGRRHCSNDSDSMKDSNCCQMISDVCLLRLLHKPL